MSINLPLYIAPSERTTRWSHANGAVRLRRLKDLTSTVTWSPPRFVFILQRVTVFVSDCVETEHRFLDTPGTKAESAFRQGVVFFRLRPRKVM